MKQMCVVEHFHVDIVMVENVIPLLAFTYQSPLL